MVYQCTSCGYNGYRDTIDVDAGYGTFQCPDCGDPVKKVLGRVEEEILETLAENDSEMGRRELANKTGFVDITVKYALKHLLQMGYLGPGGRISMYRLSTKAREEYC